MEPGVRGALRSGDLTLAEFRRLVGENIGLYHLLRKKKRTDPMVDDVECKDLEEVISEISEGSIQPGTYVRLNSIRKWYEWMCHCTWSQDDTVINRIERPERACDIHRTSCIVTCPPQLVDTLHAIQKIHNQVTLGSSLRKRCLTGDIPGHILRAIPERFTVEGQVTLGGMSRIYEARALDGTRLVMKITDVSKSLGGHEMAGYDLLQRHDIPSARVEYHMELGKYHVTIIERLECTLTTLLLAISANKEFAHVMKKIVIGLECLLSCLSRHRLAFVDFTTDNIMCRVSVDRTSLELVLIDPQFVVPMDALARKTGRGYAENIDRIHLCMKLAGISRVNSRDLISAQANQICRGCLGYVPDLEDVIMALTKRVPTILRAAYDILQFEKRHKIKNPTHLYDGSVQETGPSEAQAHGD